MGEQWTGPAVKELFGPGAQVDTIYVEEKSSANPDGWMDAADGVVEQNHRATRIILPNGERYVVDYWESMGRGGGKGKVVPESEWVQKWNKEIGSDFIAQVGHPENSPDMASVKRTMEAPTMQGKPDDYKLKVLQQSMGDKAETYFNSWKRSPW